MKNSKLSSKEALFHEIMRARNKVYQVTSPTPLEHYALPGGGTLLLKREDLSPIHAYKWRGAFNMMASQSPETLAKGIITASAGNHAQGVALSAARLKCNARIYMPTSVARMKADEVARLGGEYVEIIIVGDTFDEANMAAYEEAIKNDLLYVPAYDDILVMAGQGTIGDEILMNPVRPDVVFLQIGGGGLAAGVACVLKTYSPDIHIIGVEGEGQASMKAAVEKNEPVSIPHIDVFCDGTAVNRAGNNTFDYCRDLIDEFMTVSNDDVCAAVQHIWNIARTIPETSGAMGMAAFLKRQDEFVGKNIAIILSGANMDFTRLSWVAQRAGMNTRRYLEITIAEQAGTMLKLIQSIGNLDLNIVDFLYGKQDRVFAFPVFGFDGSETQFAALEEHLRSEGYAFQTVSHREDVAFRMVPYNARLFKHPFMAVFEFPERPGALMEFMLGVAHFGSICYFNYSYRAEFIGRAMMGFEFEDEKRREAFLEYLESHEVPYKSVDFLDLMNKQT